MPEVLIFLIILGIWQGFEYASDIKYTKVLNMLWYGYNNIIKTNVILLEFLSARFVHSGVLQLTILSFFWHELEHNHNKIFNKLFFLTTMTSELLKYLNEHLGVSSGQIITPPFKIFPLPPHLHLPSILAKHFVSFSSYACSYSGWPSKQNQRYRWKFEHAFFDNLANLFYLKSKNKIRFFKELSHKIKRIDNKSHYL